MRVRLLYGCAVCGVGCRCGGPIRFDGRLIWIWTKRGSCANKYDSTHRPSSPPIFTHPPRRHEPLRLDPDQVPHDGEGHQAQHHAQADPGLVSLCVVDDCIVSLSSLAPIPIPIRCDSIRCGSIRFDGPPAPTHRYTHTRRTPTRRCALSDRHAGSTIVVPARLAAAPRVNSSSSSSSSSSSPPVLPLALCACLLGHVRSNGVCYAGSMDTSKK